MGKGDKRRQRLCDNETYERFSQAFEKVDKPSGRKYTVMYTDKGCIEIEGSKVTFKDKPIIQDNPNHKEFSKIGKEIERFKQLDGINKYEIERRFGFDANKFLEKKPDKKLVKQITKDICEQLKRR